MKTNLFTTCRGILATLALDGLACFGELIRNFTGLITAQRREIMKSGTVANQITLEAWRIAVIFQEATMVEHRMTAVAYLPVVLLSGNGQFRRGKLQTHMHRAYFSGSGDWGQSFIFPVACSPSSRTYSLITLSCISFCGRGSTV